MEYIKINLDFKKLKKLILEKTLEICFEFKVTVFKFKSKHLILKSEKKLVKLYKNI